MRAFPLAQIDDCCCLDFLNPFMTICRRPRIKCSCWAINFRIIAYRQNILMTGLIRNTEFLVFISTYKLDIFIMFLWVPFLRDRSRIHVFVRTAYFFFNDVD